MNTMSNGIENIIKNEFIPTRGNTKFADVITFVGLNGYGFEADSALSLSSYYRDEDWLWNGIVRAQHPVTGMTRLIHAAKTNNMKSLQKVIKHLAIPARLNLQDANGKTALYWACENKHPKVLQCLLDAKAMPDIPEPTSFFLTKKFHIRAADIASRALKMMDKKCPKQLHLELPEPLPHDVPGDWFKGPF